MLNSSWQTRIGKLKLVRVNGTKTVSKHVGKLLETNRTCLHLCQLFRAGKLVFDMCMIGKRVLVIIKQSKHVHYSRDLHITKWWMEVNTNVQLFNSSRKFKIFQICGKFRLLHIKTQKEQKKMEELAEKLGLKGGKFVC